MKKFIALCLAMLMALSMCSFVAMAEETAVTFADIANGQPANFVTGDLALGANEITSSNEAVISTDGTVTRPIYNDATVSLTINGGDKFDVVVKAKTTNVLYVNDFSAGVDSEWALSAPEGNTVSSVKDGVLNVIIGETTVERTWNHYYPREISGKGPVTFAFDVSNVTDLVSAGVDIRISGKRYDAEGNKIGEFNTVTVARLDSKNGFGRYWMGTTKKNVEIKYDPATGDFWGNGVLSSKNLMIYEDTYSKYNEGYTADDAAKVVITDIGITNAAGGCTATFDLDNFVQYEEIPAEDALESATPEEKIANYSLYLSEEYVADGGSFSSLSKNLKFTADEELPEGVSITWETSDADVIAEDGTVKRDVAEDKTVTITGTLSVAGAEDLVKTYVVTVLPLTLSGRSELVDFDSYSLENGAAFAADGWTTHASIPATYVTADGNSYLTLSSDGTLAGTQKVASYSFKTVPQTTGRYYVMSYDYRIDGDISGTVNGFAFMVNGTEIAKFVTRGQGLHPYIWKENDFWYGSSTGLVYINDAKKGFVNLKMVIDTKDNVIRYYANDVLKFTDNYYSKVDLNDTITSAGLQVNWRNLAGSVSMDNLRIYCENTLDEVIPTLSAEEKVALFKGLIEKSEIGTVSRVGDALQLNSGYAAYDIDAVGVSIDWASSAPEYISNEGRVVKSVSFLADKIDVTMTATISAGAASDTVAFTVAAPDGTELVKSSDFSDTTVAAGKAEYVDDEDPAHGKVLHISNPEIGKHVSSDNIGLISYGDWKGRAVISADVKYINGSEASCGGIVIKTIAAYNGISVMFNFETNKVSVVTTLPEAHADASKINANSAKTVYLQMDPELMEKEGKWINVTVDFNALSQTFVLYIDGKLYTELPLLQANMKTTKNGGGSVRGISLECSNKGELWADNVSIRKFTNSTESEVNAALNAALVDFGSSYIKNILTNCTLPAMTIGRSWNIAADAFNRDVEEDGSIKPSNVSTYTYVTDGPAISWKINGVDATAVDVDYPQVVEITVTAEKDGISESKTFNRKVAPAAIRGLASSTEALNGVWLDSVNAQTDKVVIAQYNGKKLVSTDIIELKDNENYIAETGILKLAGYYVPAKNADVDALKVFVIGEKGIAPITFKNAELRG